MARGTDSSLARNGRNGVGPRKIGFVVLLSVGGGGPLSRFFFCWHFFGPQIWPVTFPPSPVRGGGRPLSQSEKILIKWARNPEKKPFSHLAHFLGAIRHFLLKEPTVSTTALHLHCMGRSEYVGSVGDKWNTNISVDKQDWDNAAAADSGEMLSR